MESTSKMTKPVSINLEALFAGAVCDAHELGHEEDTPVAKTDDAPPPAKDARPEKEVMTAWAKTAYEAENLPEDAKIVFGTNGKIALSLGDKCVVFYSNKPRSKIAMLVAPPTNLSAERSCRSCGAKFVPAQPKFNHCPGCYKQYCAQRFGAAPKPEAPKPRFDGQKLFDGLARAGFETDTLPEGTKVTKLGSQVTVTALGFSTTFHSERLANELKTKKAADAIEAQRRLAAEQNAAAVKRTAEAKAKAAAEAANPSLAAAKSAKNQGGKKGGDKSATKKNGRKGK